MSRVIVSAGLCLFLLMTMVNSSPRAANVFNFPDRLLQAGGKLVNQNGLGKRAATTATPTWKKVGVKSYYNSAATNSPVAWYLSSRDTTIYDASGNIIIEKSTGAVSGWETATTDSFIYSDGRLTESIYTSGSGTNLYGYRHTYSYANEGKSIVAIFYYWNNQKQEWVPDEKDSSAYSSHCTDPLFDESFTNFHDFLVILTGEYYYNYDTINLTWKPYNYVEKDVGACSATTMVFNGKQNAGDGTGNFDDVRYFFEFTGDSIMSMVEQKKNPSTGHYYDYSKSVDSIDVHGREISLDWDYDSTADKLVPTYMHFNFRDGWGNDTLAIGFGYDTSTKTWDTNYVYRYTRAYDSYGNNVETIESSYDPYSRTWYISYKSVNEFALINVPVIKTHPAIIKQNISVAVTTKQIQVIAPNCTGFALYNVSGKMVASIQQPQSKGMLVVYLTRPLSKGIYIAKILQGNKQNAIIVPIR